MLRRLLSRGYTNIPLFFVTFDYKKFKKFGKKDSCILNLHPVLKKDDFIRKQIFDIIDYIRDNYDMNDIP